MADSIKYVDNPFGIEKFLDQADTVTVAVMIVLGIMSLGSWYVILTRLWDQSRILRSYQEMTRKFWTAGNLREGLATLSGRDNVFRMLAEDGMRATHYHETRLTDQVDLNEWVTVTLYRSMEGVTIRLAKGLAILATTGSVSPFVGLLGTVWGIYNALISITLSGQTSIEHIAGPIGEALIMTAIGLFVAVPAVMGYNLLLRRNKDIQEKMRFFSADVHAYLVGGARMDTITPFLRAVPSRPAAQQPA